MTDVPVPTADETYRASLEAPQKSSRLRDWLTWPVRVIGAGLGYVVEPSFGDVVVRRRDDGEEVLRLPVTGTEETAMGLAEVDHQLETMTASAFQARWGLDR